MWQRMEGLGLGLGQEHLRLTSTPDGFVADGMLLAIEDNQPFRASYVIWCDAEWRIQHGVVTVWENPARSLLLQARHDGQLSVKPGKQSDEPPEPLEGCLDLDIYPSPFTNTLAIRRLQLSPGESAEITVAFIKLPELSVQPTKQRYTCLATGADGGRYRYEGLESGFETELPVDADGLVLDYPRWFRRVWP